VISVLIQVLQSLVVLTLAPLYAGVLGRAEAMVASKRGPSVLQPYRDLAKLLRKGSAISDQASWVFRGAPFVAFACFHRASDDDPAGRSGPVHYEIQVTPVFEQYLYRPVVRAVEWLADAVQPLQSGDVNLYLLHVFAVILLAYLLGAV
jgi:NADH dehydrogenase